MKELHPDERYLLLAEKWLNGTITPAEELEYARWYNSIPEDASLEIPPAIAPDKEHHRKKILQQINERRIPVVRMRQKWLRLAAAAAVVSFIAGALYVATDKKQAPEIVKKTPVIINDVQPGTSGAILQLANGSTIILDTAHNGKLHATGNTIDIVKQDALLKFSGLETANNTTAYNTLTTPRARQQQIILADGSHIWLNAESSIKFPSTFDAAQRVVEITGEVYFEIAKNPSKPFVVKVNNTSVTVLGTHFNVMAYGNENILKTTLLEGAVKVSHASKVMVLKPGEQSQLLPNEQLKLIPNADVELAVAWKNGRQAFEGANIEAVMRQIERWYDIDAVYEGKIPARTFTGDIPRNANLSEILKLFSINKIHYKLDSEHKKLVISP